MSKPLSEMSKAEIASALVELMAEAGSRGANFSTDVSIFIKEVEDDDADPRSANVGEFTLALVEEYAG